MNISIQKIKVLKSSSSDFVVVYFNNMPNPRPEVKGDILSMVFTTKSGQSEQYVKDNFPGVNIELSMIDGTIPEVDNEY